MSIMINSICSKPIFMSNSNDINKDLQKTHESQNDNKQDKSKSLKIGLTALGTVALALLLVRNKKKTKTSDISKIIGKNPKVETLTKEEKEKLIKELQAQTDIPEVKEEIRKLVENGEWDKL